MSDAERRASDAEALASTARAGTDVEDELFALERHVRDRDAKITLLQVCVCVCAARLAVHPLVFVLGQL